MTDLFSEGQSYTRNQIHEKVGGSKQSFLPTVNGTVVCACLRDDLNHEAPNVIWVGVRPRVQQAGESLSRQNGAIPVFIKQDSNEWQFVGMYKVERSTNDPLELESHIKNADRPLSRVIYMGRER